MLVEDPVNGEGRSELLALSYFRELMNHSQFFLNMSQLYGINWYFNPEIQALVQLYMYL